VERGALGVGSGGGVSESEVAVEQAAQLGEAHGVLGKIGGMPLLQQKLELAYSFGERIF